MTPTQNVPEDRIQIGQLRSAYGLNGWLWVYSNTEPMSNIFDYLLGTLRPKQVGKLSMLNVGNRMAKAWS